MVEQSDRNGGTSRSKRVLRRYLTGVLLVSFLYLSTEGLTFLGLLAIDGLGVFSAPVSDSAESLASSNDASEVKNKTYVLHPYLGWVLNPTTAQQRWSYPINAFGFNDDSSAIQHRADDKLIVGVFGGSVAKHFAFQGGVQTLESMLKDSGVIGEREIVFVSMGLAGHKQPQQLMALNYILASGGEFDILICLDGFNEVVLQFEGRGHDRVSPPFPRNWHLRVEGLPNPNLQKIIGERAYLEDLRRAWSETLYRGPWRYSPIWSVVRRAGYRFYSRRINELQVAFEDDAEDELSYEAAGPRQFWSEEREELTQELVDIWARSARQMHYIAEGNGALLFVFLQPNLYVENSMPLIDNESAPVDERHTDRAGSVKRGYPLLRKAGAELASEGIRFHDLTQIYSELTQSPYVDTCCHVDLRGNELIAEAMVKAIIPVLRSRGEFQ